MKLYQIRDINDNASLALFESDRKDGYNIILNHIEKVHYEIANDLIDDDITYLDRLVELCEDDGIKRVYVDSYCYL